MNIYNFKFWKKSRYAMSKEDVLEISKEEKGIIETYRNNMSQIQRTVPIANSASMLYTMDSDEGSREVYLYDILGGWHSNNNMITPFTNDPNNLVVSNVPLNTEPRKIKPIDVFHELETVPNLVTLEGLDDKIAVLKMKKELIQKNQYCKNEILDMVERLENRRKWEEYREYFEQYQNTTTEKIMDLVNKYKLVLKPADLFISKFPDEAVKIMDSYVNEVKALCKKKPIFYVIAEEVHFKDEYKRNDPILLVQSPFGAYWQILGAWDKELILLSDL